VVVGWDYFERAGQFLVILSEEDRDMANLGSVKFTVQCIGSDRSDSGGDRQNM
jgi:hypothetical protein